MSFPDQKTEGEQTTPDGDVLDDPMLEVDSELDPVLEVDSELDPVLEVDEINDLVLDAKLDEDDEDFDPNDITPFDVAARGDSGEYDELRGETPDVAVQELGGIVPRVEPADSPTKSGDIYLRLEGQIYGPFQPDVIDDFLVSGQLTGLEAASPDLKHWTPLGYHPRIVRGRIRDIDSTHDSLTKESSLPVPKPVCEEVEFSIPQAAIIRRPKKSPTPPGEPKDDDS